MTDLPTNVLYYGDNLDILRRYLPDVAVDSTRALILRSMTGWKRRSATSKSGHQRRWIPNGSL